MISDLELRAYYYGDALYIPHILMVVFPLTGKVQYCDVSVIHAILKKPYHMIMIPYSVIFKLHHYLDAQVAKDKSMATLLELTGKINQ